MTTSRLLGILSTIAAAASAIAVAGGAMPPKAAVIALTVAAVINGFTERVTGGKSSATQEDAAKNEAEGRA